MSDNPKPLKSFKLPFPKTKNQDGSLQEVDPFEFLTSWGQSAKDGFFPLGESGQCHGGIHFDASTGKQFHQADGIRCIAGGEVIAYRVDKEMPTADYDNDRKGRYSTSFVLVRHRLEIPANVVGSSTTNNPPPPPSCVFYSLYMHLLSWKGYEAHPEYTRPSFWEIHPTQRIVGKKADDPSPSGPQWTNTPPPANQKGLNVHRLNAQNGTAQLIGWLPQDAKITLGDKLNDDKYRLASVDSGTSYKLNGVSDLCTDGAVEIKKLDTIITGPKTTDKVHILNPPAEIKAGDTIGHFGEYHRYSDDVSIYKSERLLTHLEVFAGPELEKFIEEDCRAADEASDNTKSLLVIEKDAVLKKNPKENAKLAKGELLRVAIGSKAEGRWIKLERGDKKVEARTALTGYVSKKQSYDGDWLFFAAVANADGADPIYANDFKTQTRTHRTLFKPKGTFVWVARSWYENVNFTAGRGKNKNGIIEVRADCDYGYEQFPPSQGENFVADELVSATMVLDVGKTKNPLVQDSAKDDQGVRWWLVRFPVRQKKSDASEGPSLPDWREGWVSERGFDKVKFCSMWAWPGFELSENTSPVAEWFDLSLERKYTPSNPVLTKLFEIVDQNNDGHLTGDEIRQAWGDAWLAQPLSRQIVKNKSEWGLPMSEWNALDQYMQGKKTQSGIDYMQVWGEEKKRIEKLRFWDEVKVVAGFPTDISVHHIHPLGLIENFAELQEGCRCKKVFTAELFKEFAPAAPMDKITAYLQALLEMFERYGITTCLGKAHILAQMLHESTSLRDTKELGSQAHLQGKDYYPHVGRGLIQLTHIENYRNYGRYVTGNEFEFTTPQPPLPSSMTLAHFKTTPQWKNHSWDTALFRKLENAPYCVDSAGWFWAMCSNGKPVTDMRPIADADDLIYCSRLINGAFNGYEDRRKKLNKIIEVMGMNEHRTKNNSGVYGFLDSKCSKMPREAWLWARYHDATVTTLDCGSKDPQEAIIGYQCYLSLNDNTVSASVAQQRRNTAQQRIVALGGTL
ncbi:MAG: hypothetical protein FWD67_07325 [Betaproteobacteria bacterium]|nr:hypothetical protein [Betaproteobacteria bacterium]